MPGGSQYFFSLDKFPTSTSMQNFKVVALVVLEIKGVYNVHPPGPLRVAKSPVLLGLKIKYCAIQISKIMCIVLFVKTV